MSHFRFGWVREDTWGVFKEPTLITPIFAPKLGFACESVLDQGSRGASASRDFASYAGLGFVSGSLSGPAYPAVMDSWLQGIMGSAEAIADGYRFKMSDSPPSFSFQVEDEVAVAGLGMSRYSGCLLKELRIDSDLSAGLTTWSVEVIGKEKFQVGSQSQLWLWAESEGTWDSSINIRWNGDGQWGGSLDWDSGVRDVAQPYPGWATIVSVDGQEVKATAAELTLGRQLALIHSSNYDYPEQVISSPLEATGSLVISWEEASDLDRYLEKAQVPLTITWTSEGYVMTFHSTLADFGDAPYDAARDRVTLTLAYSTRILYDETDGGPGYFESVSP